MSENTSAAARRVCRPRAALVAIALTALACIGALLLRTPLRALGWAYRVAHAASAEQRAAYLGALCDAGDAGRWGTELLLASEDAAVRQYGALVLQHVHTNWARRRLLDLLQDPDVSVRRLAALGLAIHGDEGVIPALKQFFITGDQPSAMAACLALERLGTGTAITALDELTLVPADPERRAALIDALAGIGGPTCAHALLRLLTDNRPCAAPTRMEQAARQALAGLEASGFPLPTASMPSSSPVARTVAERAATALNRITGLQVPFTSAGSATERTAASAQWTDWLASHPDTTR